MGKIKKDLKLNRHGFCSICQKLIGFFIVFIFSFDNIGHCVSDVNKLRPPMSVAYIRVRTTMDLIKLTELGWINQISSSFDRVQRAIYYGEKLYPLRHDSENMLKRFFKEQGFDVFIQTMEHYYRKYDDPRMKRFISGAINSIIFSFYFDMETGWRGLKKDMLEPYLDFIVDISLVPAKRVLDHIITKAINQSPSGKVIMYQNLRLGGIYPIMEKDMCDLLASKRFPVLEINLEDIAVNGRKIEEMEDYEIEAYMDKLKIDPEFIKARIILVRFKVSSFGKEEDFISEKSQWCKFKALAALSNKDIPIVMVDGSSREISLAQNSVKETFPEFGIEMFNADIIYPMPESVYYDMPDNINLLLPATTSTGRKGDLYDEFAKRMAMTLASDEVFWRGIDSKRTISLTDAEDEREASMELKVFKGYEAFTNLREAKDLFKRLKGVVDIRASERFRHVIPLLLAEKERLKNPDEPYKTFDSYYRYPSNCLPCSVHAMRILKKFHFKAELRTIEFPKEIYPDLNINKHSFVVTEIGGKEFIIDIAADQFEPLGENKWADLGVVVLPFDLVNQYPTRFWMYTGRRVPADLFAQLLKKVMSTVATRTGI